ncbi:MAG: hypothetical protein FWD72_05940, partial [Eggerthellaceae bacterium]|nr:hypothetical protein [Eggerthellaceae bacterium]
MGFDFAVVGNGWNREFFYTQGNAYESLGCPGGGLLVAEILRKAGCSVAPAQVAQPVMTEHIALDHRPSGSYSAGRNFGKTLGSTSLESEGATTMVVYDSGMGALEVPTSLFAQAENILWASDARLPQQDVFAPLADRVFLMLTADVLRENGALISRQVSWERSATELVWQLKNNPRLAYLLEVANILVTFAEDGIVHIGQVDGELRATLRLLHGDFEGQLREANDANVPDTWAAMVAAAARGLKDYRLYDPESPAFDASAVLQPVTPLLKNGYAPGIIKKQDFRTWLVRKETDPVYAYRVPVSYSERQPDPGFWCIANTFGGSRIQDIAARYVLQGASTITGIPRFSCGALTTIDRQEIESFQNVRSLIVDYAASQAARPLSIAVFGAPGAGKSFGVTQIAKSVLPGVAEKLEFNVSQMAAANDIAAAFHQIRDVVLSGKLPIAFFDEFDSDREGRPLGWLKSFLMPMQDGKFRDESGEHPVGKCILVFAGGTSASFEEFSRPLDTKAKKQEGASFKNAKGPDFISRLRSTVNILGPNPTAPDEYSYILRRAILLRSLLERKFGAASPMPVSPDVLRAMLLVPQYKHGARSMEAVLDMSRSNGISWEPVSLPFYTQLSLHVNADAFIRLVLRDVMLNAYSDALARAVHEDYLAKLAENGQLNASGIDAAEALGTEGSAPSGTPDEAEVLTYLAPWDELGEEAR